MRPWLRRCALGLGLLAWLLTVAIAFALSVWGGVVWTALGLFYLGTSAAIKRTGSPRWLVAQRCMTAGVLAAVGFWRIGWDDVLIFPLALLQLALAFLWLRVDRRRRYDG